MSRFVNLTVCRHYPLFVWIFVCTFIFRCLTICSELPLSAENTARAYSLFLSANISELAGEMEKAEELYRKVIFYDPEAIPSYLRIAQIRAIKRDFNGAESIIEKANGIRESSEAYRLLGRVYWTRASGNKKDMKSATDFYEKALELGIEDQSFFFEYARLLMDRKDYKRALEVIIDMETHYPRSDNASLFKAELYSRLGDDENEELALEEAVHSNPQNYEALVMLAQKREEQGDLEKAVDYYEKALKADGNRDLRLKRRLGYLYYRMQNYNKAVLFLKDIIDFDFGNDETTKKLADSLRNIGKFKDADVYYAELLQKKPGNIDFRYAYAESLFRQSKYDDALWNFELVLKELSSRNTQSEIVKQFISELEIKKAVITFEKGNREEAIFMIKKLLNNSADYTVEYYAVLTSMLLDVKKYDEAEEVIGDALRYKPENMRLRLLYVDFLESTGNIDDASAEIDELLKGDEHSTDIFLYSAAFCMRNKTYEKAVSILKQALSEYPASERFLFQLGVAYERGGNIQKAVEAFESVIKINPRSAGALNYLGYMMIEENIDLQRALRLIETAVEIDDTNPAYLDSLGWAYYKMNRDLQKARKLLERAVESEEDPLILDHLGDIYLKLGLKRKAVRMWKKAIESDIEDIGQVKKKIAEVE